ncbi:hypothetical protein CU097_014800 [Rhizopus azygosporus]|uniref:Uncharacterized protein n=1 Tax=Rhizopus azygosporus TaxID=86630 RepID=A0A367K853_RHIAZ|nr:hypothetical protein CU097_014800 [Rhizopus azygosporus]
MTGLVVILKIIKHLPSKQIRVLKNGRQFLIYIERYSDGRKFHLVGFEGRDYGYYGLNKSTHPATFAFLNPDDEDWKTFTNEN